MRQYICKLLREYWYIPVGLVVTLAAMFAGFWLIGLAFILMGKGMG